MDIVAGTAGHIDHGKTALVKVLTGINTDRLPEEKQRGITIDLGFAELELGDIRFGFVDVPGHERFVKNMLAGASGIDLVLLVIAADEGVMPQTREHFEICRLLGIKTGIIVLTKKDLVDEETLALAKLEVAGLVAGSFLGGAPVVAVSSKTGEGISELCEALAQTARKVPERSHSLVTQLPIDRSFTVKGFGTVVTGTLASGEIGEGDELEILPPGKIVRVRGLQTHGHSVSTLRAGQRAAVNLGGLDKDEVSRGMLLAAKNTLRPMQIVDTRLEVLAEAKRPLRSRLRVRVHMGTAEILARLFVLNAAGEIGPGESDLVQLLLEIPIAAVPGERFIVRSYSPQTTIAGGSVLDPLPAKHKRKDILEARIFLSRLEKAEHDNVSKFKLFIEAFGENGASISDLQARTGWRREVMETALRKSIDDYAVIDAGNIYLLQTHFEKLKAKTLSEADRHHRREPLSKGISKETLKERVFAYVAPEVFKTVLIALEKDKKIFIEQDTVRLAGYKAKLSSDEKVVLERLKTIYTKAILEAPKLEDALIEAARATRLNKESTRKVFQLLVNSGEVVNVSEEFYVSRKAVDDLTQELRAFAANTPNRLIEVPKFKEIAGVSRKYAIPLLEYFDREKITLRAGDRRLVL
jgi:selenocysteine-specific elongation factor